MCNDPHRAAVAARPLRGFKVVIKLLDQVFFGSGLDECFVYCSAATIWVDPGAHQQRVEKHTGGRFPSHP